MCNANAINSLKAIYEILIYYSNFNHQDSLKSE